MKNKKVYRMTAELANCGCGENIITRYAPAKDVAQARDILTSVQAGESYPEPKQTKQGEWMCAFCILERIATEIKEK